jgi:hypothetical protein
VKGIRLHLGRLFSLGSFFSIAKVAHIWGNFFPRKKVAYVQYYTIFANMDWATFWAIFSQTHLVTLSSIVLAKTNCDS